jgi:hypothetical protein
MTYVVAIVFPILSILAGASVVGALLRFVVDIRRDFRATDGR